MNDDNAVATEIDDAGPSLALPSVDDFIEPREYPSDNDLPDELKPKRGRRSRKRERETVQAVSEALSMVNGMFALVVPCSCAEKIAPELRQIGAHLDTCTKAWPLSEDEAAALTKAIEAEFDAHPEWANKLSNLDGMMAHALLLSALFAIVMNRRMRQGAILLPEGVEPSPEIIAAIQGNGHLDAR